MCNAAQKIVRPVCAICGGPIEWTGRVSLFTGLDRMRCTWCEMVDPPSTGKVRRIDA